MRRNRAGAARVELGSTLDELKLADISGSEILIPDPDGRDVHLQLRRFAGCPVCNLHLRALASRIDEVAAANVREVIVFHSTRDELLKYQGDMPFDVVADPDRALYRKFGVEASIRSVLSPGAWRALPRGWWNSFRRALAQRRGVIPLRPTGGNLGLPADILIRPDGTVGAVHYGRHAYDQWSVDEVLARVSGQAV